MSMNAFTMIRAAGVALLVAAALLMSPAAPAGADAGATIQNAITGDCLDQHYNASNQPTITVYAWPDPCHFVGNQQWNWVNVGGNSYRAVNVRSGWCLSAPNGAGSRVHTEYCVTPLPNKQKWTPYLTPYGTNILVNALSGQCLRQSGADVYVAACNQDAGSQRWFWT
jgi:hypothetical protein